MCRALCEPPTLPVSSFTQMPPVDENPSASDSSSLRVSGVRKKPVPATRDTASSADVIIEMRSASLSPNNSPNESTARYLRNARYGFASSVGRNGSTEDSKCKTWCRSDKDAFGHNHDRGVAIDSGTPHTAHTRPVTTPAMNDYLVRRATRWLNSVMRLSHTGAKLRTVRQNDCERRASNTASGVPCCSTHV